jgi:hypothetical protein
MTLSVLLIGFGAGTASALLYAAVASGSPLAVLLLYVAPLPILLAGVGWRHTAGLVAAVVAALALTVGVGPKTGLYYALVVGVPSWWLAYLALLARPGATPEQTEWYPIGRLVIWTAALGAVLVTASIPLVATTLEEYRATLREVFSKAFESAGAAGAPLPTGQDPKALVDFMALVAPGVAATFWTASSILNLWLAGRITRASGRLVRPWPDLRGVSYPTTAAYVLLAAFAGSFAPGLVGLAAELFAATFLIAFALLGLATLHVATQKTPARGLILFATYAMLVLQPWIVVFLAGLGLGEQFFNIRRRFGPPPGGPPTAVANLP